MNHLRKLLELDSLPKMADEQVAKEITGQFLLAANGRKQDAPQLIGIGGGPSAGKSFLYEQMQALGKLPVNAVVHDPDLVMQVIPEYREDAQRDPAVAFSKWELPARHLANEILLKALVAQYHIIYMRSFALPDSLKFVRAAIEFGYRFEAHMVTCDLNVALARAKAREEKTKRHIPSDTLIHRHEAVVKLIPEITSIADSYFIYENSKNGFLPELKASATRELEAVHF